jgi:hypothetical protein
LPTYINQIDVKNGTQNATKIKNNGIEWKVTTQMF